MSNPTPTHRRMLSATPNRRVRRFRLSADFAVVIVERWVIDPEADLSWLDDFGPSGAQRLASYGNSWEMLGCSVEISLIDEQCERTAAQGFSSLWGIESDSDSAYKRECFAGVLADAVAALRADFEQYRATAQRLARMATAETLMVTAPLTLPRGYNPSDVVEMTTHRDADGVLWATAVLCDAAGDVSRSVAMLWHRWPNLLTGDGPYQRRTQWERDTMGPVLTQRAADDTSARTACAQWSAQVRSAHRHSPSR
jgi:hypothetical protein